MKKLSPKIILSVWIYIGWFGCVYFGKKDFGLASVIFPLISWVLVLRHYRLNQLQVVRLSALLVLGILFDTAAVFFKLIHINPPTESILLPLWLISLWLLFVSSLPLFRSLLKNKYLLASLLGAVGGPLSYRAGAQFELLHFDNTGSLLIYALFWSVFTPCALYWLGQKELLNESS